VLSFGLESIPDIHQQGFSGFLSVCCAAYLDKAIVYSQSLEKHRRAVRTVLEGCAIAGYAKLSKSAFEVDIIKFLGHVVGTEGVRVERSRVETLESWPARAKSLEGNYYGDPLNLRSKPLVSAHSCVCTYVWHAQC
jgi:hypothetical protein